RYTHAGTCAPRSLKTRRNMVRKRVRYGWVAVVLYSGIMGCANSAEEDETGSVPPAGLDSPTVSAPATPPPLVSETIAIEGMPEVIEARVVEAPVAFPLGFTTVVPSDMAVDFASSGEGDALHVEAEFGGVRNPDATFIFLVMPEGTG